MGSIDIIKPLSLALRSADNKSQQHQEKNTWECRESNRRPQGVKQERNPLCNAPTPNHLFVAKLRDLGGRSNCKNEGVCYEFFCFSTESHRAALSFFVGEELNLMVKLIL